MARLAIFVDGGYVDAIARREAGVRVDVQKLVSRITSDVQKQSAEPVDLFRTFYYTCPPHQNNPPTQEDSDRTSRFNSFRYAIERLPRLEMRLGRLQLTGTNPDGSPRYSQKQVGITYLG